MPRGIVKPYTTWKQATYAFDSNYVDVDCSALVSSGTTMVQVYLGSVNNPTCGIRKNGSTQDILFDLNASQYGIVWVALDSNRIFELKSDEAIGAVYIISETDADVTGLDPWVEETPTTGSWQQVNSTSVPNSAVGVFVMRINKNTLGARQIALRHGGSTDARQANWDIPDKGGTACLVGQNAAGEFGAYREDSDAGIYVTGYLSSDATGHTEKVNATDVSQATTGAFTDLDLTGNTSATADYVIIELTNTSAAANGLLRENGSAQNLTQKQIAANDTQVICVGMDGGQVIEYFISNASVDFYLRSYGGIEAGFVPKAVMY